MDLAAAAQVSGLYIASGMPGSHQKSLAVPTVCTVGRGESYGGGCDEFIKRLPAWLSHDRVQLFDGRHAREDSERGIYDAALRCM